MQKIRVLSVFGTRPEVIKFIPVLLELEQRREIESIICVTGQHREMLDQMMQMAGLNADIDLDLMQPNQTLPELTSRALLAVTDVLEKHKPDRVLVQGDTTTGFATTLAAFYAGIAVGHIEAGLRSGDLSAPWPEEFNRKVISIATDLHFAPTESAEKALLAEHIPAESIYMTGNTVIDALHYFLKKLHEDKAQLSRLEQQFSFLDKRKQLILVTAHRRENHDGGIASICEALKAIAEEHPSAEIIFPVHLNPKVKQVADSILADQPAIHLTAPQDYFAFIYLMNRCHFLISDSGGVQEEAPGLKKPVLVTRNTTERPEGIKAGVTKLVGTDPEKIKHYADKLLKDEIFYASMQGGETLYGDGHAAKRIAEAIIEKDRNYLSQGERLKKA